ncbi:MAG: hypothetical protein J6A38_00595 [Clostridia bacterium]|nr:hypothetical protein [Clostridia bacterium]
MDIFQETQAFYNQAKTEKTIIGRSTFGREIYAVKVGQGSPVGIAQYAMHGREFITAKLAMEQYKIGVQKGSMWFIPLVNPDGALISQIGLDSVENEDDRAFLRTICKGETFALWKANGRGVDLNVNFPAKWGKGKKNVRIAGAENYIGNKPFSETETQALKTFTEKIRPDYTVSYHTKGEEIYWYFYQSMRTCPRDKGLASVLSASTGYTLAYAKGSVGGYKDWCIQRFQIPSFTIEAGADSFSHPLQDDGLQDILRRNAYALYDLSGAVARL